MLLNSSNNEYVKRADGGFARGQATEDFWQKPAGSSSSHLAAGAAPKAGGALGLGRGGARGRRRARGRGGLRRGG